MDNKSERIMGREHVTLVLSSSRTSGIDIADSIATLGQSLVLILADAGVVLARKDHPKAALIKDLSDKKVTVFAEEYAASRRGITEDRFLDYVSPISTKTIADLLVDTTTKVIWL